MRRVPAAMPRRRVHFAPPSLRCPIAGGLRGLFYHSTYGTGDGPRRGYVCEGMPTAEGKALAAPAPEGRQAVRRLRVCLAALFGVWRASRLTKREARRARGRSGRRRAQKARRLVRVLRPGDDGVRARADHPPRERQRRHTPALALGFQFGPVRLGDGRE